MKITIDVDDKLFQNASWLLATADHSAVISTALQNLVERESARRLARLGGTEPDVSHVARRRLPEGPTEL